MKKQFFYSFLYTLLLCCVQTHGTNTSTIKTQFWGALKDNNVELVKFFLTLNRYSQLNLLKVDSVIPFHPLNFVACSGSLEMLKLFYAYDIHKEVLLDFYLKHGGSTSSSPFQKILPVHYAAQNKSIDCLTYIINCAPLLAVAMDTAGFYPMHHAAKSGNYEAITYLLSHHAPIDSRGGPYKITPLHIAAQEAYLTCLKLLIDKGADINAETTTSKTPLYFAQQTKHKEIINYLIHQGATIHESVSRIMLIESLPFTKNSPGFTELIYTLKNAPAEPTLSVSTRQECAIPNLTVHTLSKKTTSLFEKQTKQLTLNPAIITLIEKWLKSCCLTLQQLQAIKNNKTCSNSCRRTLHLTSQELNACFSYFGLTPRDKRLALLQKITLAETDFLEYFFNNLKAVHQKGNKHCTFDLAFHFSNGKNQKKRGRNDTSLTNKKYKKKRTS